MLAACLAAVLAGACGGAPGPAPSSPSGDLPLPLSSEPSRTILLDPEDRFANLVVGSERYDEIRTAWQEGDRPTWEAYTRDFLELFDDAFDFVIFAFDERAPSEGSVFGRLHRVRTSVGGLGMRLQDSGEAWGSADRLLGVMTLARHDGLAGGPSLHEFLHVWGQQLIYTESPGHWGFAGIGGQLGGWTPGVVDTVSERYFRARYANRSTFGVNANGGNSLPYAPLELYLMGLIPADSVPPFVRAAGGAWVDRSVGTFAADELLEISMDDLIEQHGERSPAWPDTQREFRALYIVVSAEPLTDEDRARVSEDVRLFSLEGPNGLEGRHNFWEATGGRATLHMSGLRALLREPGG
jgi:hypothetical protein